MVNKILASAKIMAVLKGKKQNKVEWEDSVPQTPLTLINKNSLFLVI